MKVIKIIVIAIGAISVTIISLIIACIFLFDNGNKQLPSKQKIADLPNVDSLIVRIKNCSDYEIKQVYYNPGTQALCIALTNKDNVITEHVVNNYYFDKNYGIDNYPQIEGTYIYQYKKGKSLAKAGDYDKPIVYNSKKLAKKVENFTSKYYSITKGIRPIYKYLHVTLNGPESFEYASQYSIDYNEDGTYHCVEGFRAKNAFGALVYQKAFADIDEDGNIVKFSIE